MDFKPWIIIPRGASYNIYRVQHDAEKIATAHNTSDARLIAAAPVMFEALKEAQEALSDILNAADNRQPYKAKELQKLFLDTCNKAWEVLEFAKKGRWRNVA